MAKNQPTARAEGCPRRRISHAARAKLAALARAWNEVMIGSLMRIHSWMDVFDRTPAKVKVSRWAPGWSSCVLGPQRGLLRARGLEGGSAEHHEQREAQPDPAQDVGVARVGAHEGRGDASEDGAHEERGPAPDENGRRAQAEARL